MKVILHFHPAWSKVHRYTLAHALHRYGLNSANNTAIMCAVSINCQSCAGADRRQMCVCVFLYLCRFLESCLANGDLARPHRAEDFENMCYSFLFMSTQ